MRLSGYSRIPGQKQRTAAYPTAAVLFHEDRNLWRQSGQQYYSP